MKVSQVYKLLAKTYDDLLIVFCMGCTKVMFETLTDEKINFLRHVSSKKNDHNFNLNFDVEGATGKGVVRPGFYHSSNSPSYALLTTMIGRGPELTHGRT